VTDFDDGLFRGCCFGRGWCFALATVHGG
jgi:hypothetical protein